MALTRRRFLSYAMGTTVGAAVLAWLAGAPRVAWRWLTSAGELGGTVPGTLNGDTEDALVAFAATLLDRRIELSHYQRFFRWRAENLPGHVQFYERVGRLLDAAAKDEAGAKFVDSSEDVRVAVLHRVLAVRQSRGDKLRAALTDRTWLRLDRHLIRPLLGLFMLTDAWILIGYPSWPGMARGLEAYTRPVGG